MEMLAELWNEESGQGMAEYSLVLAFVALVCIMGFSFLGGKVKERVENVGNKI